VRKSIVTHSRFGATCALTPSEHETVYDITSELGNNAILMSYMYYTYKIRPVGDNNLQLVYTHNVSHEAVRPTIRPHLNVTAHILLKKPPISL
jgi:hypothetical protein